ncbi:MAG TPA: phospholipase D-like domain-containing protein [Steroidobacteraceae bacterium]|nr:phospholipase D-like domain-containing protein [Steroidobacteraceae bacterium]
MAFNRWFRTTRSRVTIAGVLLGALATILLLNFATPERRIQHAPTHQHGIGDPQFRRELGVLLGPPLLEGNTPTHFENGEQIFPAMLAAIRSAQRTITFETYIYWSGDIGREFAQALSERARAGVQVHVLLDWVGSQKIEAQLLQSMKEAGVQVQMFHPLRWYHLARMNNRTHRKLLVIDGREGFTGGVGIADNWNGHAQDPDHWRDSHYRITGPAVAQMQAAFTDNWIKTSGVVLEGDAYFPALTGTGGASAQVFSSSPQGGADSMVLMYLLSIAASERTIDLSAAYFVPDDLTMKALLDALRRGVRVRIITPGPHIDAQVVKKASRASWGALLAAGAQIYEYQPTMFHCKTFIVDELLVSVGSTNFDSRSFRLNDEANLNVIDQDFARQATTVFEADLGRAKRVTLQQWRQRPWHEKVAERAMDVFSSQL